MNYVRLIRLSLKHHRFTPSGFKVVGIGKFEFGTKTQFLCVCKLGKIVVYKIVAICVKLYGNCDKHKFLRNFLLNLMKNSINILTCGTREKQISQINKNLLPSFSYQISPFSLKDISLDYFCKLSRN